MAATGAIMSAMRFEGSNDGRGQVDKVAGSINATEVRVSERVRVKRNEQHDESDLELLRDTIRQFPDRGRSGECRSIIVRPDRIPFGLDVAIDLATQAGATWHDVQPPTIERTAKRTTRKVSTSEARRMRHLAIVGNADTDGVLAQ
jgi:hypothetical protein